MAAESLDALLPAARVSRIRWRAWCTPLKRAWRSAAGSLNARRGLLIRIETDSGLAGEGECAPLPAAGTETLAAARAALPALLAGCRGQPPQRLAARLAQAAATPALRCALEAALLDLAARARGRPLFRLLAPGAGGRVAVNAALGALDAGIEARLEAALEAGFRVLKIKLGLYPPDDELRRLRALAARLPAAAGLRLDANRAWTPETARSLLRGLAVLPVESLEEPLAAADDDALRRLQSLAAFPLALDESLAGRDPAALLAAPPVRRLVLKPMVLGGLLPAWRLARRARAAGLETVVTSTLEAATGLHAALQLAAALDDGRAHGLATGAWLRDTDGVPLPRDGRLDARVTHRPARPAAGWVDA